MDWLRYANQSATRNQPLDPKLVQAMSFLPELGLTMEVFSGGQPGIGSGGARVGSTRHDHGGAADVKFYRDGRMLDWANQNDQPLFGDIVKRAKSAGVTGFGAGDGYMQPGSMHIGFGNPGVWGAGGKGANAAAWLSAAFNGTPLGNTPVGVTETNVAPAGFGINPAMGSATMLPAAFGLGTGPAAPVFGQVVGDWMARQKEQQQEREIADQARRTALFAPPAV
jgi:hypothetical protein